MKYTACLGEREAPHYPMAVMASILAWAASVLHSSSNKMTVEADVIVPLKKCRRARSEWVLNFSCNRNPVSITCKHQENHIHASLIIDIWTLITHSEG